jgi:hypothetical protein
VNLVLKADEEHFMEMLVAGYKERTGIHAKVYPCIASSGANVRYL